MKKQININQEAIVNSKIDIDVIDAAIIDYVSEIHNWKKVVKMQVETETYYWVSYNLLINQMPLLGLKKDTVYRRIKKLAQIGLILVHPDSQKLGKTFMCLSNKSKDLIFSDTPSDSYHPINNEESEGSDLNPSGYVENPKVLVENSENSLEKASDSNPLHVGLKSELLSIGKEDYSKDSNKKEENEIPKNTRRTDFSFIDEDYLKSLPNDNTPIDLDGQPGVLKAYSFLIKLPWEDIRLEAQGETAGACDAYRHTVMRIMNEKYEIEKQEEIARDKAIDESYYPGED